MKKRTRNRQSMRVFLAHISSEIKNGEFAAHGMQAAGSEMTYLTVSVRLRE